jgi:serine/threonine-protein kinase
MDSPASDVWAIGTTLYLLLTDEMPYPELDHRDIRDGSRFLRPLRPASVYNIGVDSALDAIVSKCLALRPVDRYSDALAVLDDLRRWRPDAALNEENERPLESAADDDGRRGRQSAGAESSVKELVERALQLASQSGGLSEAADLLEEAIGKAPDLREKYEAKLHLWRRGICM